MNRFLAIPHWLSEGSVCLNKLGMILFFMFFNDYTKQIKLIRLAFAVLFRFINVVINFKQGVLGPTNSIVKYLLEQICFIDV